MTRWPFLAVLTLLIATVGKAADNGGSANPQHGVQVEISNGILSVESESATLSEVMRAIGLQAGFKTMLAKDFVDFPMGQVSIRDMSVLQVVQSLVSDENRIIFYRSEGADSAGGRVISQVWLLGESGLPATFQADDVVSDEVSIAEADERTVKSLKTTRMTDILQSNPLEAARVRAVIALGAVGDESAVPALESALHDTHQSVRLQAISALGRIGGEQAITIVGNVLLQSGMATLERVRAAEVLQHHGGDIAGNFLQAAAFDSDAQVRLASENPPTVRGGLQTTATLPNGESAQ